MRKIILVISLMIFFWLGIQKLNISYAAVLPCEVSASGSTLHCTVCEWKNNNCVVSTSQSTCRNSGYDNDPAECRKLTTKSQCEGPSGTGGTGNCKEAETPVQQCYYLNPVFKVCEPRALGSADCQYDTSDACENAKTAPITEKKYRCNSAKGTCSIDSTCSENNNSCMTNADCESKCNISSQPNSPLSLPCPTGGASYDSSKGCTRIKTAFGWVSTGTNSFTRWMLGFVLSIAGGIVTVVAIIAGYKIMTSQGDPDKVKNAREQLTAAIVGLIFIIFSLAILELITRDILGLPGFGG